MEQNTILDTAIHIAILIDDILIIAFSVMAVHYVIAKKIDKHCRWALHLFMAIGISAATMRL